MSVSTYETIKSDVRAYLERLAPTLQLFQDNFTAANLAGFFTPQNIKLMNKLANKQYFEGNSFNIETLNPTRF